MRKWRYWKVSLNRGQTNKSILVVDDELDIVNLFTELLKSRKYDVFGFTNPLKALEDYKENYDQYRMVISDIRMPEMNGFDLVKNVKKINTNISIILISVWKYWLFPTKWYNDKWSYTKTNQDNGLIIYCWKAFNEYHNKQIIVNN